MLSKTFQTVLVRTLQYQLRELKCSCHVLFLGFFHACDRNLVCGGLDIGISFIFNRTKIHRPNSVFFNSVCYRFTMVGEEIWIFFLQEGFLSRSPRFCLVTRIIFWVFFCVRPNQVIMRDLFFNIRLYRSVIIVLSLSFMFLSCSKIVQLLIFVRLPTDFEGFGLAWLDKKKTQTVGANYWYSLKRTPTLCLIVT